MFLPGADISIEDRDGNDVITLASKKHLFKIVAILEKARKARSGIDDRFLPKDKKKKKKSVKKKVEGSRSTMSEL